MRIALVGATGQLGTSLVGETVASNLRSELVNIDLLCVPRSIDVGDYSSLLNILSELDPQWVINAAALTNVDYAESNLEVAFGVNAFGAANVARAAKEIGARSILVSTEAVFDGKKLTPYSEFDACSPVSAYGASKLAGENLVQIADNNAIVTRTSWLYAATRGANFPTRLYDQLVSHDDPIEVVGDVVGNPTPSRLLAQVLLHMTQESLPGGLYHVCCLGSATKFDWAIEIAESLGFDPSRIVESHSDRFPTPARRPKHVDLSCEKFLAAANLPLPEWRHAWKETLTSSHYQKDQS